MCLYNLSTIHQIGWLHQQKSPNCSNSWWQILINCWKCVAGGSPNVIATQFIKSSGCITESSMCLYNLLYNLSTIQRKLGANFSPLMSLLCAAKWKIYSIPENNQQKNILKTQTLPPCDSSILHIHFLHSHTRESFEEYQDNLNQSGSLFAS